LYYEAWNKIKENSPTFDREFAKEKIGKPTYRKFIDENAKRQEIDDAIPPKFNHELPQLNIANYEGIFGETKPGKTGLGIFIKPIKSALSDIDTRSGLPLFRLYMETQEGMRNELTHSLPYMKRLQDSVKGLNLESKERIYDLLEQKNIREEKLSYDGVKKIIKSNKSLNNKFGALTEKEWQSAKRIRNILNEAGKEFGIPMESMVLDYAPRIRKTGISGYEAVEKYKLPEEYKWWALEQRKGYLMPHERDIYKVVSSYILRGARKKYLGPSLDKLSKVYNDAIKDGSIKRLTIPEANVVRKYIEDLHGWPTGFDAATKITGSRIVDFINKLIPKERFENVEYKKIIEKIKTKEGKVEEIPRWVEVGRKPGYFDTRNAIDKLIEMELNLTYAGAMGFRPMTVIRNIMQSMLSLPILGPKYWIVGVKKALTVKGMAECQAKGILMDNYMPVGGEIGFTMGIIAKTTRTGLWGFRMVDSFNRAVAYLGMKAKVEDLGTAWLKKVEKISSTDLAKLNKSTKRFIKDTDLEFFHRAIIDNEVLPLLRIKDIKSLSERMGKHMAKQTQWVYRRANSPYWMQGKVGKLAGQFGVWPTWYIDYMHSLTRGSKWNAAKRIAIFTGMHGLMYEIGKEVFGVDIKKWVFGYPALWTGSPILTALEAAKDIITGSDYERQAAIGRLKQYAKLHIPYYLAIRGLISAHEEIREEDQIKRMIGFTPTYEE